MASKPAADTVSAVAGPATVCPRGIPSLDVLLPQQQTVQSTPRLGGLGSSWVAWDPPTCGVSEGALTPPALPAATSQPAHQASPQVRRATYSHSTHWYSQRLVPTCWLPWSVPKPWAKTDNRTTCATYHAHHVQCTAMQLGAASFWE